MLNFYKFITFFRYIIFDLKSKYFLPLPQKNMIYSPLTDRYNSGINYRRAGKSGVRLSEIALGFWHNFGDVNTLDNSRKIMRKAFDNGINYFDLADNYGPSYGSAEETFGTVFEKDFKPFRDEMFIATKAGHDMWDGPFGEFNSRKHLMAGINNSLKRMKLDYVDIFYSHRYDPETPLEETLQTLVDIVRSGKALYVGISKYPADKAEIAYKYLSDRDVHCLLYQGRYNMLNREPETGILPLCEKSGVGFAAFSPLAQGLLTGKYLDGIPSDSRMMQNHFLKKDALTPETVEKLKAFKEEALSRNLTPAQYAIKWLLENKTVASVIVGVSKTEQLEELLSGCR